MIYLIEEQTLGRKKAACFRRPLIVDSMNRCFMALGHGFKISCSHKQVLGLEQEPHRSS
jgi:hypothetical protein